MTDTDVNKAFGQARALIVSYVLEGAADDTRLPEILMTIRETCGFDAFNRILVIATAIKDRRFDEYGLADPFPILLDMEITNDLKADVERFLSLIEQADKAGEQQAWSEVFEEFLARLEADTPLMQAATRAVKKHGDKVTFRQIAYEFERV